MWSQQSLCSRKEEQTTTGWINKKHRVRNTRQKGCKWIGTVRWSWSTAWRNKTLTSVCIVGILMFLFLKRESYYIALADLELTTWMRLALSFQGAASFHLLSARVKGVCHHAWPRGAFWVESEYRAWEKIVQRDLRVWQKFDFLNRMALPDVFLPWASSVFLSIIPSQCCDTSSDNRD